MEQSGIVYFAPNLEAWKLDNAPTSDGLTYEKEAIYVGNFVKDDKKSQPIYFGVDDNLLLHWKNTVDTFLQNGIEIPVPLEHTSDPTKNRGKVVGARIGVNTEGKNALYHKIKFNDAEAAKLATSADISIFVPPDFTDGLGRTYQRPIRHVALTNYPTIPGLSKFQPIAASFTPGQQMQMQPQKSAIPPTMTQQPQQPVAPSALLPLAQQLGVPQAETLDDAAITTAIVGVFQLMKDKIDELEAGGDPNQQQQEQYEENENENGETQQPPFGKKKMKTKLPPAFAASFGKMLKDNRTAKLDALVTAGCILPPARDALVSQFCSEPALALSLNSIDENAEEITDTAFDAVVEALKKNRALKPGEKSGPQIKGAMALSNPASSDDDEDNIVVRDAERRAKEFAANTN